MSSPKTNFGHDQNSVRVLTLHECSRSLQVHTLGRGCGSIGEHMPCMQKVMSSVPSISGEKDQVVGGVFLRTTASQNRQY